MQHACHTCKSEIPASKALPVEVATHPCFSEAAHHVYARMHLAVAPKCNIKCNYCNRLYDCPNESRPGVTSEVLSPREAVIKVEAVLNRLPNLTVVGIAGPGDPLANDSTLETLDLVHEAFPQLTLCISTNGLLLPDLAQDLADANVSFVTVTVNAVDPRVAEEIYSFVRYRGQVYRGSDAATLLLDQQRQGIAAAVRRGMVVKVNSVMIPGVNAEHLPEVSAMARQLGAHVVNIMPLIPVAGTKFAGHTPPTRTELERLRNLCEVDIKQMRHCRQCRADAIGLLDDDLSREFAMDRLIPTPSPAIPCLQRARPGAHPSSRGGVRIAVASKDGIAVNQHFGHALEFLVYQVQGDEMSLLERRSLRGQDNKEACGERQLAVRRVVELLRDCRAIIASHIGPRTKQELLRAGIEPVETYEEIKVAVRSTVEALAESHANNDRLEGAQLA